MNSARQNFLEQKKKMLGLSPAEQAQLDSFPLIVQGLNLDGTPAGCLVIERIPGETADERLVNFLARGTHRTPDEVRHELAMNARNLGKSPVLPDQVPTAEDESAGDELPVQAFELDGRGTKCPCKHQPWIRPATSWDLAGDQ